MPSTLPRRARSIPTSNPSRTHSGGLSWRWRQWVTGTWGTFNQSAPSCATNYSSHTHRSSSLWCQFKFEGKRGKIGAAELIYLFSFNQKNIHPTTLHFLFCLNIYFDRSSWNNRVTVGVHFIFRSFSVVFVLMVVSCFVIWPKKEAPNPKFSLCFFLVCFLPFRVDCRSSCIHTPTRICPGPSTLQHFGFFIFCLFFTADENKTENPLTVSFIFNVFSVCPVCVSLRVLNRHLFSLHHRHTHKNDETENKNQNNTLRQRLHLLVTSSCDE